MTDADRFRSFLVRRLLLVAGGLSFAGACGGGSTVEDEDDATASSSTGSPTTGSGTYETTECIPPGGAGGGGAGGTASAGGSGGAGTCPTVEQAQGVIMAGCGTEVIAFEGVVDGECCYRTKVFGCVTGRPFTVAGEILCAPVRRGPSAWAAEGGTSPRVADLTPEARAILAAGWTRDALGEHASVASFGRFALELMALGAPPELLAAAHRAANDEIEHARACFALASAYAGEPIGPGMLAMGSALEISSDLVEVAARAAFEGCVGETLAAVQACEQLAGAGDPAVRAVLARIAHEEARHAELAWQTVAWAIAQGGAPVERAVRAAIAEGTARWLEPSADEPETENDWLRAHGRLTRAAIADCRRTTVARVVAPCGQRLAMLASPATTARAMARSTA